MTAMMFTKLQLRSVMRQEAPILVCLVAIALLLVLPTGFEEAQIYQEADRCTAQVEAVDNTSIRSSGLVRTGEQRCTVRLLGGRFSGSQAQAINLLTGSLEQDKLFASGDKALVVVSFTGEQILSVTMVDHYRIQWELFLAAGFALFLVAFGGRTGFRAIASFALTILAIWKLLVPLYLRGHNPIGVGLLVTLALTVVIITMVYGFDRRSAAAVSGAVMGIVFTCVLGVIFTRAFRIHGAVMSYSESLLYSGFSALNLTEIFMATIFIGASGAVMDLAVDITSAVNEVCEKRPDLGWLEATKSGMNVGRAAMGTMTTTLLFAYSGGYLALMMVFMAQGTPVTNILNYKYVAAEIIHTMVGSFGLVLVAPFTALCAGRMLAGHGVATSDFFVAEKAQEEKAAPSA